MKTSALRSRPRGMTMIVVLALLFVMFVLVMCAAQSVISAQRELRGIEQKQIERWRKVPARTGSGNE